MEELAGYREEILNALENVVAYLTRLCKATPDETWHTPSSQSNHTAYDYLAHLHALESQVFAVQLPRIIREEMPLVPVFGDHPWPIGQYASSQPIQEILDDFAQLRTREVAWLRSLPTERWSCLARHPWWGIRTLQWWVELQLEYSHQHLQEISAILHR